MHEERRWMCRSCGREVPVYKLDVENQSAVRLHKGFQGARWHLIREVGADGETGGKSLCGPIVRERWGRVLQLEAGGTE